MKFTKRAKWIAALSVLAVGIPAAGGAFAFPGQHLNTANPPAITQQAATTTASAPATAGTVLHNQAETGTHNPAGSQTTAPAQNNSTAANTSQQPQMPAPEVKISTAAAHNALNHQPVASKQSQAPAKKPVATAAASSGSWQGNHIGHNGPNDNYCLQGKSNAAGAMHGGHGTGGHE